ncbi:MAG: cytochrome C oxidase subunit IV family protein [Rhodobacterales bacterium]|nr:cytochrome C oxidase subunit IV family protein [Rhodobacterales bacterium]
MEKNSHPTPTRFWLRAAAVWVVLSLALAATVAGAFLDIGAFKLPLALAIAAFKAGVVAIIFMELAKAGAGPRLAILAGGLWFALMIGLTFADVATRQHLDPAVSSTQH